MLVTLMNNRTYWISNGDSSEKSASTIYCFMALTTSIACLSTLQTT